MGVILKSKKMKGTEMKMLSINKISQYFFKVIFKN